MYLNITLDFPTHQTRRGTLMSQQPLSRGSGRPGAFLRASMPAGSENDEANPATPDSATIPKPSKPPKPPKVPLSERLPSGVYDARPQRKLFVLHWAYFWLWARLGLYKTKLPKPRPALREYRDRLIDTVDESVQVKQLIYAVLNSKGGAGKTPITTWLMEVIKCYGKRASLVLEANEKAGNAAYMLSVDVNNTLTLRQYIANLLEFTSHSVLDNKLGHDPHERVAVIASDQNANLQIKGSDYIAAGLNAARCYPFVGQDAGNGLYNQSNLGAVQISDVLLFAACVAKPSSYRDMQSTFAAYRNHPQLNLKEKVEERSLVVLLGNSPKQVPQIIEEYRLECRPEQIKLIPKDEYMLSEKPVNLKKIKLKTLIALLELAKAALELAPDTEEPRLNDLSNHFVAYEDLDVPEEFGHGEKIDWVSPGRSSFSHMTAVPSPLSHSSVVNAINGTIDTSTPSHTSA